MWSEAGRLGSLGGTKSCQPIMKAGCRKICELVLASPKYQWQDRGLREIIATEPSSVIGIVRT